MTCISDPVVAPPLEGLDLAVQTPHLQWRLQCDEVTGWIAPAPLLARRLRVESATATGVEFGLRRRADSPQEFYYLILISILIAWFITSRLKKSRLGRAWMAIREDEDVAAAMSISRQAGRIRVCTE